jgi:hypothetical protein
MKKIKLFALIVTLGWSSVSFATCADTEEELDALTSADFSVTWSETTANDGKPMLLKMSSRNNKLYFVFEKTREGVWAEGAVQVCTDRSGLVVTMDADDIELGPRAPGLVKMAMRSGARFKVIVKSPQSIHVSTSGWKGDFEPK